MAIAKWASTVLSRPHDSSGLRIRGWVTSSHLQSRTSPVQSSTDLDDFFCIVRVRLDEPVRTGCDSTKVSASNKLLEDLHSGFLACSLLAWYHRGPNANLWMLNAQHPQILRKQVHTYQPHCNARHITVLIPKFIGMVVVYVDEDGVEYFPGP